MTKIKIITWLLEILLWLISHLVLILTILDNFNNEGCENNIFVHFRQDKLEDNKYLVDIYARYKEITQNKTMRDIVIEDIDSLECQQEFMGNFHQFRKNIPKSFI